MTKTLLTQACTITAMLTLDSAIKWMNDGYGLNPLVAMPIATLLIIAPYVVARLADSPQARRHRRSIRKIRRHGRM